MNKVLSVIAGLLIVGSAVADDVVIYSENSWDTDGSPLVETIIDFTQYSQLQDVETWFAQNAESWIIEEVAGKEDINAFGWYVATEPTVLNEIFPGLASNGAYKSVVIDPPTDIGFYIKSGNEVFYTQSGLNAKNAGQDHIHQVAVFQNITNSKDYILAWEDISMKNGVTSKYNTTQSDGDFNDLVVRVRVPEPATLGFIGLSLLSLSGISLIRRRK